MEAIEVREKAADKKKAAATMLVFMLVAYPAIVIMDQGRIRPVLTLIMFTCVIVFSSILIKSRSGSANQAPVIVLDHEGILDTRLKVGKILWSDITRVHCVNLNQVPFICIETRRNDFYLDRRSAAMKTLLKASPITGLSPLSIATTYLDKDANQILEVIAARLPVDQKG